jgi:hypothetical protein
MNDEQFAKDYQLVKSMIGRTIVDADWRDANPGEEFGEHEYAVLKLDDGRIIRFASIGYDSSAVIVGEQDSWEGTA